MTCPSKFQKNYFGSKERETKCNNFDSIIEEHMPMSEMLQMSWLILKLKFCKGKQLIADDKLFSKIKKMSKLIVKKLIWNKVSQFMNLGSSCCSQFSTVGWTDLAIFWTFQNCTQKMWKYVLQRAEMGWNYCMKKLELKIKRYLLSL